jgi:hypothetical protein
MATTLALPRWNVGNIAERIVANELEVRGFRVSDLNIGGVSANADLIAAGHDKVWQIQVKGATNTQKDKKWVQYGYCTPEIIRSGEPMFNRRQGFYRADIVVLVAVRSPTEYRCIVLRTKDAERAAQLKSRSQLPDAYAEGHRKEAQYSLGYPGTHAERRSQDSKGFAHRGTRDH